MVRLIHDDTPLTSFSLDEKDIDKLGAWLSTHNKTCKFYDDGTSPISPVGANGGRLTYEFTRTGLGVVVVVRCACKDKLDLTHYEDW